MKYAPDAGRERSAGWNLAPLIGVLVALIVVFIAATPAARMAWTSNDARWCGFCVDGACTAVEELTLVVGENGLVRVNGREMAIAGLADALRWPDGGDARTTVTVEIDFGADYGDAVQVLSQLQRAGVPESVTRIQNVTR